MSALFNRLVEISGLSSLFARAALERACTRAGVQPTSLTREGLRTALPEIERTIQTYLDRQTTDAMARIRDLAGER
ncbi:MAG: hypothetical protein QM778_05275 [Myxococcales bacterium]